MRDGQLNRTKEREGSHESNDILHEVEVIELLTLETGDINRGEEKTRGRRVNKERPRTRRGGEREKGELT